MNPDFFLLAGRRRGVPATESHRRHAGQLPPSSSHALAAHRLIGSAARVELEANLNAPSHKLKVAVAKGNRDEGHWQHFQALQAGLSFR